jgi:hypothetical protein
MPNRIDMACCRTGEKTGNEDPVVGSLNGVDCHSVGSFGLNPRYVSCGPLSAGPCTPVQLLTGLGGV